MKPKRLALNLGELEAILERTRSSPLSEEDHDKLKAVLSTLAYLTQELEKKRTSIERLRRLLFGPRTEKLTPHPGTGTEEPPQDPSQATESSSTLPAAQTHAAETDGKEDKDRAKGHGRNGADAYPGAHKVEVPHQSLYPGDPCPQSGCTGKVYKLGPSPVCWYASKASRPCRPRSTSWRSCAATSVGRCSPPTRRRASAIGSTTRAQPVGSRC